ncbi:hypothetical protein QE152_g6757 [Popillia japonica]|uniref:Endonuclease/exonuclease/phosphatase domain-containing protein n=1 Tax=Popillia japonica TaxID=7064 RepID=A0AAW1MH97_POPJA
MDDFLQILDSILQEVSAGSNYTIILSGDFNIDLAKCGVVSDVFVDMLRSYNLHQTITNPTRITARSQTIIDNIFVNLVDCDGDVIVSALSDTARSQTIIDNIFVNLVDCDGDVIVSALKITNNNR